MRKFLEKNAEKIVVACVIASLIFGGLLFYIIQRADSV